VPVTGGAIAFLVDTSGSMEDAPAGTVAGGRRTGRQLTRLRAAKEQILLAAQAMPPESTFSVLTFATKAHRWTAVPIKPTPSSLRSLTELLSRLQPHGGTNLHDGLVAALQLDQQRYGEPVAAQIDELFVLSDGQPTAGEVQDTDTLLAVVREANKYAKVRIHTVFTGTGEGAELLRRLAAENGGVFVQR
jgi:Mg-chelatase subunit ChlD